MEVNDSKKLYELQEYDAAYDSVPFESQVRNVKIHEKSSGGGRLQTVLQLIQLILLVILLIAVAALLYRQYTSSDSSDCSPASVVGSNDKVLTDLANTSTDTQSAVKEVSQIMLAEIERRLNDTATLNRLAATTDVSSQRISDALNAIFTVTSLANETNGAVDTSAQQLLHAIFNVSNVANATSSAVVSNNEKLTSLMSLTESLVLKIGSNYEEEREHLFNNTELLNRLINGTSASAAKLMNIVNTLSKLEGTGTSTAGVADDILLIVEELLELHNETAALPTSCQQIKQQQSYSPNGYYTLAGTSGTYSAYCNMGTLCGSSGGGWTRLAYLDMSDSTQSCPSGFRLYQSGSVRACGRPGSSASCVSVQFPSNGISYSQICGRVTGYQFGSPDAVDGNLNNINSYYVEGVSITHGSPRQHVWTLMAGLTEALTNSNACPCNTGSSQSVQSFIGSNYFCESGNSNSDWRHVLYSSDPLWDGQDCPSNESPCCSVSGIPWFHRDYGNTATTDNIELRVCGDQEPYNEDSPVSLYEIYIR